MGPAGPFGLYLAPTPLFYATLLSFLPTYLPTFLRAFPLSPSRLVFSPSLSPLVAALHHGRILKFGNVTPGPPDESSYSQASRCIPLGPAVKKDYADASLIRARVAPRGDFSPRNREIGIARNRI